MPPSDARQIRARVLRASLRARTPGFHFPRYLLDVQWEAVAPERSRLSVADGEAIRRCDEHLASGSNAFLEQFWLGPGSLHSQNGLEIATGAHTRNRVGHVQGGLLLGIAAWSGSNAAPQRTRLSNVCAWYL